MLILRTIDHVHQLHRIWSSRKAYHPASVMRSYLKIFSANKTNIHVDTAEGHGTTFLKVKVQVLQETTQS